MTKIKKSGQTAVAPCPAALITAFTKEGKANAMTAAWVSNICFRPPTLVVGIRSNRLTYELIEENEMFGVNIPDVEHVLDTDYCGIISGRKTDKFEDTNFTVFKGDELNIPLINECPINLECKLVKQVNIGTHDAFFGEILAAHYEKKMLNEKGVPDALLGNLLVYGTGNYYCLEKQVGSHSFSKNRKIKDE
jgi:flavin reductase (DIM6/NTAB) family NADH-FMN oxidoreductase RutF